jgi:hypothetical protein
MDRVRNTVKQSVTSYPPVDPVRTAIDGPEYHRYDGLGNSLEFRNLFLYK